MTVADAGINGKWNNMGMPVPATENQMFVRGFASPEISYQRQFRRLNSYQTCTAGALLMHTVNGEAPDDDFLALNNIYWSLYDEPRLKITTGFRIWEDPDDDEAEYAADGGEIQYSLWDFGIVNPLLTIIEPVGELRTEGAFALISAAATALVAALMI